MIKKTCSGCVIFECICYSMSRFMINRFFNTRDYAKINVNEKIHCKDFFLICMILCYNLEVQKEKIIKHSISKFGMFSLLCFIFSGCSTDINIDRVIYILDSSGNHNENGSDSIEYTSILINTTLAESFTVLNTGSAGNQKCLTFIFLLICRAAKKISRSSRTGQNLIKSISTKK